VVRDRSAVIPLIRALREINWDVRAAAIMALGDIGDRRAVEPLLETMQYIDSHYEAREALAKIGEPAVESLIQALDEKLEIDPIDAVEAIRKIGKPAVEPLIRALRNENQLIRKNAAIALGRIGDPRAVEGLVQALKDEDVGVRKAAEQALHAISFEKNHRLCF